MKFNHIAFIGVTAVVLLFPAFGEEIQVNGFMVSRARVTESVDGRSSPFHGIQQSSKWRSEYRGDSIECDPSNPNKVYECEVLTIRPNKEKPEAKERIIVRRVWAKSDARLEVEEQREPVYSVQFIDKSGEASAITSDLNFNSMRDRVSQDLRAMVKNRPGLFSDSPYTAEEAAQVSEMLALGFWERQGKQQNLAYLNQRRKGEIARLPRDQREKFEKQFDADREQLDLATIDLMLAVINGEDPSGKPNSCHWISGPIVGEFLSGDIFCELDTGIAYIGRLKREVSAQTSCPKEICGVLDPSSDACATRCFGLESRFKTGQRFGSANFSGLTTFDVEARPTKPQTGEQPSGGGRSSGGRVGSGQ